MDRAPTVLLFENDNPLREEVERSMRRKGIVVHSTDSDQGAHIFLRLARAVPYAAFRTFTHPGKDGGTDLSGAPCAIAKTLLANPALFEACHWTVALSAVRELTDQVRAMIKRLTEQYPDAKIFPLNRGGSCDIDVSEGAFWEEWAQAGGAATPEQMKRFLLDL